MFERNQDERHQSLARTTYNEANSMSVFCREHPLTALRPFLARQGVVTARELRRIASGGVIRVTGLLVLIHMPPTKSGKRVIFITTEDETGLMDLVAFPKTQEKYAEMLLSSEVQTVEGRLQRQGRDGLSISIIIHKVIPRFTGSLAQLLRTIPRTSTQKTTPPPVSAQIR
jgi:error-prone DNA polymerase